MRDRQYAAGEAFCVQTRKESLTCKHLYVLVMCPRLFMRMLVMRQVVRSFVGLFEVGSKTACSGSLQTAIN